MIKLPKVVLDTNVLVAGLRSRRGASFQLLQLPDKRTYSGIELNEAGEKAGRYGY